MVTFFAGAAFFTADFFGAALRGATFLAGVSSGMSGAVSAVRAVPELNDGVGGGCGAAGEGFAGAFSRGGANLAAVERRDGESAGSGCGDSGDAPAGVSTFGGASGFGQEPTSELEPELESEDPPSSAGACQSFRTFAAA